MAGLVGQFHGLMPDVPLAHRPSGAAETAMNVHFEGGRLQKRAGFDEYATGLDAVRSMFVAHFASGSRLVVNHGTTLAMVDADGAGGFDIAKAGIAAAAGWGYMWADRFHYMDSDGALRVRFDGVTINDGLKAPTGIPVLAKAAYGEKEGFYHVHVAVRNSKTGEMSQVGPPGQLFSTGACETRVSEGDGGIVISTDPTEGAEGDWDEVLSYCTLGNTEDMEGKEVFSFSAYLDGVNPKAHAAAGSIGLSAADHVLNRKWYFRNAGGQPPASSVGLYTGVHAVYGNPIPVGDSLTPDDAIMFSIPNFPTMVPQFKLYTATSPDTGVTRFTFSPLPWVGQIVAGMNGPAVAACFGGGVGALFTQNSTYVIRHDSVGRPRPTLRIPTIGCIGPNACAASPHGIYFVGSDTFGLLGPGGWRNLSGNRFESEIRTLIAAAGSNLVVEYYSYKDQVWIGGGDTILVWDRRAGGADSEGRSIGELTKFQIQGQVGDVTAMVELAFGANKPVMLVGTSGGKIYRYPTSNAFDPGADFVAEWEGHFGQERLDRQQRLDRCGIYTGLNCAGIVTLSVAGHMNPADANTGNDKAIVKDLGFEPFQAVMDENLNGRSFSFKLASAAKGQTGDAKTWTVDGILFRSVAQD